MVLATTRSRVWARLIDLLITILASLGLLAIPMALMQVLDDRAISDSAFLAMEFVALALVPAVWMLLRVALTVWSGATVGQRIMGIRPVMEEDGGRPGWRAAFRRWVYWGGHSTGDTELPFLHDHLAHRRDKELGRCRHDRQAGTVVVRAGYSGRRRAVLAVVAGALVLAPIGTVAHHLVREALGPPFAVETYYGRDRVFKGRGVTFERTTAKEHGGEEGCLAGAVDGAARDLLARAGCTGRLSASFVTADGSVRISSHILRFDDAAVARQVAATLKWDDLAFVAASGDGRGGLVDEEENFVVVTVMEGDDGQVLSAFHTTLLGVIIWRHF